MAETRISGYDYFFEILFYIRNQWKSITSLKIFPHTRQKTSESFTSLDQRFSVP